MKVRKRETFQATQWHKHGDHPSVNRIPFSSDGICVVCKNRVDAHGYIGSHNIISRMILVCPGSWVVNDYDDSVGYHILTDSELFEFYEAVTPMTQATVSESGNADLDRAQRELKDMQRTAQFLMIDRNHWKQAFDRIVQQMIREEKIT